MRTRISSLAILLVVVTCYSYSLTTANAMGKGQSAKPGSGGKIEILRLKSAVFHNTRSIRVLLPPGYDSADKLKLYPVLYLNDGIMVFRPAGLGIQEIVTALIKSNKIEPIIVVGIDNGASTEESKNPNTGRADEFLPYPDVGFPPSDLYPSEPPNPRGKLYPRFLIDEVMPLINKSYTTRTDAASTGLGGFSYGGVAALYTVMSRPGIFGKLLLESTPLWIGPDRQLLKDAETVKTWPKMIYIGSGTKESPEEAVNIEGSKDKAALNKSIKQNAPGNCVKITLEEGGKHDPASWRGRLPAALEYLFGKSTECLQSAR